MDVVAAAQDSFWRHVVQRPHLCPVTFVRHISFQLSDLQQCHPCPVFMRLACNGIDCVETKVVNQTVIGKGDRA